MGTYSTWEHYETFGGWPERGETYPSDPDALIDQMKEDDRNIPHRLGELENPADIATGDNW